MTDIKYRAKAKFVINRGRCSHSCRYALLKTRFMLVLAKSGEAGKQPSDLLAM